MLYQPLNTTLKILATALIFGACATIPIEELPTPEATTSATETGAARAIIFPTSKGSSSVGQNGSTNENTSNKAIVNT